tara:strand:- start:91 stop:444 length:354 start_codon:yes stop_codon:yes gene_type:complete
MKHTLFDLKECLFKTLLDDEEYIKESLKVAAEKADCKILNVYTHKFEPQGVTGFAMLAESHLSIHTWPQYNIAKCDIFTCNYNNKPKLAIEYLQNCFHSTEVTRWTCDRSTDIDMVL